MVVDFFRSIKVGTLDWARPFPADASSTSSAGNSPVTESPYIVVKRSYFLETEEVFHMEARHGIDSSRRL